MLRGVTAFVAGAFGICVAGRFNADVLDAVFVFAAIFLCLAGGSAMIFYITEFAI